MGSKSGISKFVWVPRIIAIAYVLFLLVFTLDSGASGIWERITAYVMNALPAIVVAACLAVFWRRPKAAGWMFIALAVAFTVWFNAYTRLEQFLIVPLPLLVIGVLFLLVRKR